MPSIPSFQSKFSYPLNTAILGKIDAPFMKLVFKLWQDLKKNGKKQIKDKK